MGNSEIKYTEDAYSLLDKFVNDFYKILLKEIANEASKEERGLITKGDVSKSIRKVLLEIIKQDNDQKQNNGKRQER